VTHGASALGTQAPFNTFRYSVVPKSPFLFFVSKKLYKFGQALLKSIQILPYLIVNPPIDMLLVDFSISEESNLDDMFGLDGVMD
jgi:hypothetical protein